MTSLDMVVGAIGAIVEPRTGLALGRTGFVMGVSLLDSGTTVVLRMADHPYPRRIVPEIRAVLESIDDLLDVKLEWVVDPRWSVEMATDDEARRVLSEALSAQDGPGLESDVWDELKRVIEPEIGVPITDIGLIYGVDLSSDGHHAHIRMTLTSPACPVAPYLIQLVQTAATQAPGIRSADVELVWDPPWDPYTMIDEDLRDDLGIF